MATPACPCGRADLRGKSLTFAACCGRYLDDFDQTPAPDAESLMRSRYSAFVLGREPYLRATWHVSHRPVDVAPDHGTQWLCLEVRRHTQMDADHAEVEFVARYRMIGHGASEGTTGRMASAGPGRAVRIHERSRFVREAGRWYYVDGDLL